MGGLLIWGLTRPQMTYTWDLFPGCQVSHRGTQLTTSNSHLKLLHLHWLPLFHTLNRFFIGPKYSPKKIGVKNIYYQRNGKSVVCRGVYSVASQPHWTLPLPKVVHIIICLISVQGPGLSSWQLTQSKRSDIEWPNTCQAGLHGGTEHDIE